MRCRRHLFKDEHGDGIGFLAEAAPGDPDPQRVIEGVIAHESGDGLRGEMVEHLPVAEEAGDVDQQILGQDAGFLGVAV